MEEDEEKAGSETPPDDRSPETPQSPYWMLFDPSIPHQQEPLPPAGAVAGGQTTMSAHRRSQSEVVRHRKTGSFQQRLRTQMQRAWKWGGNGGRGGGDEMFVPSFNPELLANQKRQWYQLHSKTLDNTKYREPATMFEHFIIAGLPHNTNMEAVENAFASRKKWESEMAKAGVLDLKGLQNKGPSIPLLEPQVLFMYPPGKRVAVRLKDLAAFCFPAGVKSRLPERTPSLSDLNELVYGQEHMGRDDSAFVYSLRVGDNDTLYGVCLHVSEIVQRPPGVSCSSSPMTQLSGSSRFIVSAPRCYCLLTRVPFFDMHFEVLNSIVAQERLNRITQFMTEASLNSYIPFLSKRRDRLKENFGSLDVNNDFDWMSYAIPVDSVVTLAASAAGLIPEDDNPTSSPRLSEPDSPESVTISEASDCGQARDGEKDCRKDAHGDDCFSELSETRSECLERIYGSYENGHASPEIGMIGFAKNYKLERLGSFDTIFSPVRSTFSEDEYDDLFSHHEADPGDDLIMEWAKETKNDFLQIICSYHALPLAKRGSKITFHPVQHLQAIEYDRPSVAELSSGETFLSYEAPEVCTMLAAAEESRALSIWTTATVCRVLSLESVLTLLAGVLLEKQVVVVCSNLGVLSAVVMSIIPMIRPFQWQSLLLPILPSKMFDFLDAPVPYVVGIHNKPTDLKLKTSNLVHVNVQKDQVKTCQLPTLPRYKELVSELRPIHAKLSFQSAASRKHPVYRCNEEQADVATRFLEILRRYLESLCSDLKFHTITSVQANNDRVSLLLKDSFVDSFPSKDRPFVKLLVDTQQFALLSDSRMSTLESRRF